MTIRYVAFHNTEPGFKTAKAVERWIAQQEDPADWIIVQTTDDFAADEVADQALRDEEFAALERAYVRGREFERSKLRALLGL